MSKLLLQRLLLAVGVVALLVVLIDLGISIAATNVGTTPVRVEHVQAGAYRLTVSLYRDPASAGYALPFAIMADNMTSSPLAYQVFSVPGAGVDATPVRATFSTDPNEPNGIKGAAEITVKGPWSLQIQIAGAAGKGMARLPVVATALPAVPIWLGWFVGFVPLYVLGAFFLLQMTQKRNAAVAAAAPMGGTQSSPDVLP
jgi:hypothetical protein